MRLPLEPLSRVNQYNLCHFDANQRSKTSLVNSVDLELKPSGQALELVLLSNEKPYIFSPQTVLT